MRNPRLALISRRYWPLLGGAEVNMSRLAFHFHQAGAPTTVLTAQWDPHWPSPFYYQDVPIVRLPMPMQRWWGTVRYMVGIARWLKEHRSAIDAVYVSMLKHDAYAALGALSQQPIPIVLRAEGAGESGDCHWQQIARFGQRIRRRCQLADAIIAPSLRIREELLAADYPADRIHYIPNAVTLYEPRTVERRWAARAILSDSHPDMVTTEQTPVVVYTGRLHRAKGLFDLLHAWPMVLQQFRTAQLWLIGEGPDREELFETILDLDLRRSVVMPGAFDDVQDVLQAADVFVLPSTEEGLSLALLEAMSASVPIVASDIPGNRELITSGKQGTLVPLGQEPAWAAAICQTLAQPHLVQPLVAAAYQRVASEFTLPNIVQMHLDLFRELQARKRAT
ncbi:MAG: glycosyltransferase family 4 protein [Planctomycetota bacterium]